MAINSWIILGVLAAVFVLVVFIEIKLEARQQYFECYLRRCSRYEAIDYKCKGIGNEHCQNCPYHKKYIKNRR